jgi:hypothetical protein
MKWTHTQGNTDWRHLISVSLEIENMTHPHSGYVYLDLGALEIVRTELE